MRLKRAGKFWGKWEKLKKELNNETWKDCCTLTVIIETLVIEKYILTI